MLTTVSVALATPPAIIERAERACSRQTWYHPERSGHGAAAYGSTTIVVECERSESNVFRVDRITVFVQSEDGLADPSELTMLEERTCKPFRGTPCEVSAQ